MRPAATTLLLGLMRKELIRPHAVGDEDGFRFRHALIRDAAYEGDAEGRSAQSSTSGTRTGSKRDRQRDFIVGYHLEQAVQLRRELAAADESTARLALEPEVC